MDGREVGMDRRLGIALGDDWTLAKRGTFFNTEVTAQIPASRRAAEILAAKNSENPEQKCRPSQFEDGYRAMRSEGNSEGALIPVSRSFSEFSALFVARYPSILGR